MPATDSDPSVGLLHAAAIGGGPIVEGASFSLAGVTVPLDHLLSTPPTVTSPPIFDEGFRLVAGSAAVSVHRTRSRTTAPTALDTRHT